MNKKDVTLGTQVVVGFIPKGRGQRMPKWRMGVVIFIEKNKNICVRLIDGTRKFVAWDGMWIIK